LFRPDLPDASSQPRATFQSDERPGAFCLIALNRQHFEDLATFDSCYQSSASHIQQIPLFAIIE